MKYFLWFLFGLASTVQQAWSADTLRVSLAKSGVYAVTDGTVIRFVDFVPQRFDTVRFVQDTDKKSIRILQNQLKDLALRTNLTLVLKNQKIVELDLPIALPAQLQIGTASPAVIQPPVIRLPAPAPAGAATPIRDDNKLAGYYYDDATKLVGFISSGADVNQLRALLRQPPYDYLAGTHSNPYIERFIEQVALKAASVAPAAVVTPAEGGLTGILNPTTAINSLAVFVADRFREEVTIAFLDRMRTWLDASLMKERVLFPSAYAVMARSDPFQYTTFLGTLRDGFAADLTTLPVHTIDYLDANRALIQNQDVRLGLKTALHITDQVRLNAEPLVVLRQLDSQSWLTSEEKTKKLAKGLRLVSILTRGATRQLTAKTITLLSREDLETLQNENLRNAFFGLWLLAEKTNLEAIPVNGQTLYSFLSGNAINAQTTERVLAYLQTITDQYQTVKSIKEQGLGPFQTDPGLRLKQPDDFQEIYFQYIESIRLLVEKSVLAAPFFQESQRMELNDAFVSSKKLLQVAKHISLKRYGLALSGTVDILQPLLLDRKIQKATLTRVVLALNREQKAGIPLTSEMSLAAITSHVDAWVNQRPGNREIVDRLRADSAITAQPAWLIQLMQYGNFMVTIVNAQSTQEMTAALEAAALPVGSYRIKRNSHFSIGLNAFGGLYTGSSFGTTYQATTPNTVPSEEAKKGGFIFGPSAPVGITFGWGSGRGENRKDGRFWGVSIPLLDVGGVFAFRLLDSKAQLPELSWSNVFTPGLYLVHEPKVLPALAISTGVQYGPALRGISLTTDQKTQADFNVQGWRIGLTLTVDIPIFNLYSRYDK